ncbi:Coenzyme F420 hydrogenase/dehydrogenase, beta subunit C-terminal domain [Roseibacterium sp. SDUM158016]|uniref:Coenzyme F420 hydrogenase/dehydrogenase, beta subunit C-terminal domain n=1 Tax=Roseicyclus sediminis TaxID=2980997 RepID=UPI0021CFA08F|nr:Coenzyme F420 hydrogenase/dehydrogenase, beta subunit C-terminal domain [Roseibacterium sp. SDUM158016]MCU4653754.1 Coenzyme F420 hydrogenase/dehydrogenase, beta subunit C-terminal domain [Roseibacterium sp. SDUM158016]
MIDTPVTTAKSLSKVVYNGYCIGCGGCAAVSDGISIEMGPDGQYIPNIDPGAALSEKATFTCPFTNDGPNEDVLGKALFGEACTHDTRLGWYGDLYAGHVAEGCFRKRGASGGVITWIAAQLLESGLVDAVVHVGQSAPTDTKVLFQYSVSRTSAEIVARAKSRYYPIEMSQVMEEVRSKKGRYAFIGLPCFVKTVRRMVEQDPVLKERIAYTIGLVCGHLKSENFSNYLAWEKGIAPGDLEEIDFRIKLPDRRASDYGIYVRSATVESTTPVRQFLGGDWGVNFFRYSACDYCDDVFAETADVAVGDAWLPDYSQDPAGGSVVLVRSKEIANLISQGRLDGSLAFDEITADQMAQSQAGGLRDRRQGLAYRLFLRKRDGIWVPNKRVTPNANVGKKRQKIYRQRLKLRELSHSAWHRARTANSFKMFTDIMTPEVKRMRAYYRRPFITRAVSKLSRLLQGKS